ncbi:hypothetical protein BJ742DRAFT_824932 [Cladochytrium replicatum]|nr:hypothetical protein BJ742DRAFT_824932 [Cladochytrium replicatum]
MVLVTDDMSGLLLVLTNALGWNLRAREDMVIEQGLNNGVWEQWDVISVPGKDYTYYLRNQGWNTQLTLNPDGRAHQSWDRGAWQELQFHMFQDPNPNLNGKYAIFCPNTGRWLSAAEPQNEIHTAGAPNLGEAWVAQIYNPGLTIERISFGQIKHDPSNETVEEADTMIIRNATSQDQSPGIEVTSTTIESSTTTQSSGFKLGYEVSASAEASIGIVDVSTTSTLSFTFSAHKSLEQTTTKTREFTLKSDILVKKNSAVKAALMIVKKKYTVPYTATVIVTRENMRLERFVRGNMDAIAAEECYFDFQEFDINDKTNLGSENLPKLPTF